MERLAPDTAQHKIRVLVADDEKIIAQSLAVILNLAGYEVCAVYDGEAAVKLLNVFQPNLVITDVSMPGLSGVEVAYTARTVLPRCRILLFTGQTALHHLFSGAAGSPPFECITKPVHPTDLLTLLEKLLHAEKPAMLVPIECDDENIH